MPEEQEEEQEAVGGEGERRGGRSSEENKCLMTYECLNKHFKVFKGP